MKRVSVVIPVYNAEKYLRACLAADANRRQAIFDAFFRGYTSKQWGRPPEEIDPSIIRRVPVRANYDTNYFNDYWQGIPADGRETTAITI